VAGPEVVVGESKRSNKPSKPAGMYDMGWFPALFSLKMADNAVFYLKVLNKMYSQDVL
jgi:hypothetical protein